jgi:hypothetical protein
MIYFPICVEETQKACNLEQMARPITHASQLQLRMALMRDPESLDERGDPGAVDIAQLRQVDDEDRQQPLAE